MPRPEDRRIRRTRASIKNAFLGLMAERSYDAITIQNVIDRADVGRSTFYAHFSDKDDLLDEALSGLRYLADDAAAGVRPTPRRPLPFSGPLFRHVAEQRPLAAALLGPGASSAVIPRLESVLRDAVAAQLMTLTGPEREPGVPLDLLAQSVVAICLACLRWWVANDFEQPPEQLASMFEELTTPVVRQALPGQPTRR